MEIISLITEFEDEEVRAGKVASLGGVMFGCSIILHFNINKDILLKRFLNSNPLTDELHRVVVSYIYMSQYSTIFCW